MLDMMYMVATENDLSFIIETYDENIGALHGACRSFDTWKNLLLDKQSKYYIVYRQTAVAWFRIDLADDEFYNLTNFRKLGNVIISNCSYNRLQQEE